VCRALAHRPSRQAHASLHRIFWLHRLTRPDRVGILQRSLLDCAGVHLCIHCRPCRRPRGCDLGLHIGDLPEPAACGGSNPRQLHTLDFRRTAHNILPKDGRCLSTRIYLCLFYRNDGPAADLGEADGSGNQGCAARTYSTPDGHRLVRPRRRSCSAEMQYQFFTNSMFRMRSTVRNPRLAGAPSTSSNLSEPPSIVNVWSSIGSRLISGESLCLICAVSWPACTRSCQVASSSEL